VGLQNLYLQPGAVLLRKTMHSSARALIELLQDLERAVAILATQASDVDTRTSRVHQQTMQRLRIANCCQTSLISFQRSMVVEQRSREARGIICSRSETLPVPILTV